MKQNIKLSRSLLRTQGRSLIEIMIALTIGMVILIAISTLFIGNRQSFRSSDDKARLDEEGRLALNLMAFHVRMSGYGTMLTPIEKYTDERNPDSTLMNKVYPATYTTYTDRRTGQSVDAIRGCAGGFADTAANVATVGCAAGTSSDAFLVRYVVDQDIIASGGAVPTDCLGSTVSLSPAIPEEKGRPGAAAYYLIENRFYVQNNAATGNPELYCRGNGATVPGANLVNPGQPIAENVESLKIIYGLAPDAITVKNAINANNRTVTGQSVNQLLTADLITTSDMWSRVISVRICIVVRSANDNISTTNQSYRDCNDNQVVATDRRLRGVFSTTVAIRNRSVGAT
ncbi:PilW family protein [Undibacterium flavidum]|uniref:PilW family protein n=1 Tax=Undibacterium flavidum TaxID=2762297 RepID=A0ABR6YDH9_9BURK|nr:PilW family protein [Undibacterium flavidum]MBC3874614.1 PilW family protein [Undibacterium flavidum]